jgi:hypothetical protein
VNKGYARWPKGGTKAHLGPAKKSKKTVQNMVPSTSEPWNGRTPEPIDRRGMFYLLRKFQDEKMELEESEILTKKDI